MKDRYLIGLDVAKYILTKVSCTHLKLEKLTYMCYAEYYCEHQERLFEEKILAYRLGPIILSVYEKYRCCFKVEDDKKVYEETDFASPIKSRLMAAKDGMKKIISIENTILKYGSLSASELVNLTHRNNSPWFISGKGLKNNQIITDDLILSNHKYESIDI